MALGVSVLITILAVLVVFGGLIFFHELGHFLVARSLGMGVSTFSLGFGPKILKKKVGKTEYALSLLPLGGYVALVGETKEEEIPEGFTLEDSFGLRPAWQRLLVVLAGPFANFILAYILCLFLTIGWGQTYLLPSIGAVVADSPAANAGVQPGDRIIAIDGVHLDTWHEMGDAIAKSEGSPMKIELVRKDKEGKESQFALTMSATKSERKTVFGETETAWLIGIRASGAFETRKIGFFASIGVAWDQCFEMLKLTWQGFVKLIERVVPADQVGGPIMIAQVIGEQAENGLAGLLGLAALISINLGILNILPVPVLDGGTAFFCLIEMILRRPINKKFMEYAVKVGIALLIALMVFATFNDVMRLIRG